MLIHSEFGGRDFAERYILEFLKQCAYPIKAPDLVNVTGLPIFLVMQLLRNLRDRNLVHSSTSEKFWGATSWANR